MTVCGTGGGSSYGSLATETVADLPYAEMVARVAELSRDGFHYAAATLAREWNDLHPESRGTA